jgi:ethanolamine utilization protein EutL
MAIKLRVLHYPDNKKASALCKEISTAYDNSKYDKIPPAYPCENEKLLVAIIKTGGELSAELKNFVGDLTKSRAQNVLFVFGCNEATGKKIEELALNAGTKLAGEFIGILAGEDPAEVKSGLDAAVRYIERDAHFVSANDDDSIVYFAHCISRTGSYLSKEAGVQEGTAMAYLIAPPAEAIVALDAALKAAEVELRLFYGPPTETNFAGGLLTGDQAACKAACEAFAQTVCNIADAPIQ